MNGLAIEQVGNKTRQSVKWSFGLQVFQKLFFYASSIILARILTPADFGLATMAITLDTITWIVSCLGINSALVHYQDKMEERLDAAFWLFIISFGILTSMQILIAPHIAALYKAPMLEPIIRVTAISMFIYSFGTVQRTLLIKNMDFKKISILDAVLNFSKSFLYVVFALTGFGVWSFIFPKVIAAVLNNIMLWRFSRWRPRFKFYFKYWAEMLVYGKSVLFSNIIDYTLNNSSYILIGSLVGSVALGIYTFAYDKSMMVVSNIAYPVNMITLPAFSMLQDHRERLQDAFFKTIKMISILVFPCTIAQIALASEFITTLFGNKWLPSVPIFQMILYYSMFRAVSQCGNPILQGVGKPEIVLKWNLIYAPVFIAGMLLGFKLGGLYGIGAATAITGGIGAAIYVHIVVKVLGWAFNNIYKALAPALMSSLIMMIPIIILKLILKELHASNALILAALLPVGISVYLASMRLLFPSTFILIADNFKKFARVNNQIDKEVSGQKA